MKKLAFVLLLVGCAHNAPRGELLLHITPPEARVVLDDHDIGTGQMIHDRALRLRPGVRRLEVEADGYYAARREATVTATQRNTVTIDLRPIPEGMHD